MQKNKLIISVQNKILSHAKVSISYFGSLDVQSRN